MHRTAIAAAGVVALHAAAAAAGTSGAALAVTATVAAACRVSAAPLAFGTYTPSAGPLRASSRVRVACARGVRFNVALGAGTTAGASFAQRLLADGSHTLQYNLYANRADSVVWGDGTAGTRTRGGRGRGVARPVSLVVYGMLPDDAFNQAAVAGAYSDTISVTVYY